MLSVLTYDTSVHWFRVAARQFDTYVHLPMCNRSAIHFNVMIVSRRNA
jgi:hypothetical protein